MGTVAPTKFCLVRERRWKRKTRKTKEDTETRKKKKINSRKSEFNGLTDYNPTYTHIINYMYNHIQKHTHTHM